MDQKRVTRSHSEKKRKIEALKDLKTEHFGVDVSSSVKKARLEGGKLDEEERRATTGRIARGKAIGPNLSDLIPKSLAKHILEHRESGDVFSQKDNRIDPRRGGAYKGFLVSSTRVSGDSFDSGLKEIGEPLSPNPNSGSGEFHRTHTTPYNLAGVGTNKSRTVNAFGWANITIDGFIERKAKNAAEKYGEGNVFHFRFDTHNRSSVGYVVERPDIKDDDRRWKVVTAQYKRK